MILAFLYRYGLYGGDAGNELVCPSIPDIEWIETLVTLVRQDSGFGFRIVGGTEEGSQVGISHSNILFFRLLHNLLLENLISMLYFDKLFKK